MKTAITRCEVDAALQPWVWDLGNQVLYSLCREHPKHDRPDAIVAKVWLIGRAYAAAIERRKNATHTSDDFYETAVVEQIRSSMLDQWLAALPDHITDPWGELGATVVVHKRLMDVFSSLTGLEKRSLASKYLHFHRPDLFFIYDSRAKEGIAKVSPSIRQIARINAPENDWEYLTFVRRCQWLRDEVRSQFGVVLTPRQLDKLLLGITDRSRRSRNNVQT
jgi:hypothetical protein